MGCGAVCGSNSSIYQPNHFSRDSIDKLLPLLTDSHGFINKNLHRKLIQQIKQNPLKYRLKITQKIQQKQEVELSILSKWKVILYGLDNSNQNYINCLGFVKAQSQIFPNPGDQIEGLKDNQEFQQIIYQKEGKIYQHSQFGQIEKDLDRTFQHPKFCQKTFQRILKRITNHFPKMGYTQGINFIVGFLLIIGYSQFDAFWIFVHIAINRRYLLLGLFEDGFPLSNIYKTIFKNVLKRKNRSLYQHLYQNIKLDQSIWVFKWFFTYFIYSFPFQMIKYVWDIVVQIGGIGLVGFALGITNQISDHLLQLHDFADVSVFFQQLKDLKTFNQYIKLNKVIQAAYTLNLCEEDYQGIQNCKGGFYATFFIESLKQKNNQSINEKNSKGVNEQSTKRVNQQNNKGVSELSTKGVSDLNNKNEQSKQKMVKFDVQDKYQTSEQVLNKWYKQLIKEREQFVQENTKQSNLRNKIYGQNFASQYKLSQYSDSQSRCNGSQHNLSYSHERQRQKTLRVQNNRTSLQIKNDTLPSTGYSYNKKSSRMKHCDIASEIDELWDQEQDNNQSKRKSQHSQISHHSKSQQGFDKSSSKNNKIDDTLDKFAITQKINYSKSKLNSIKNITKASTIFPQDKVANDIKPKINNFQINNQKRSNIALAGQSILNNLSMSNTSHYQSSMSQCSKSSVCKKQKQNNLKSLNTNRYCGCAKIKTQEYKSGTQRNSVNSDRNSVIDNKTSSNISASNESVQDDRRIQDEYNAPNVQSRSGRLNTHTQFMVTSLTNPKQINQFQKDVQEPVQSQIQLFNDKKVFKKKNRISTKINGGVGANQILKRPKMIHAVSQFDIIQKQQMIQKNKMTIPRQFQLNYQQSYQSILVPISEGKSSNIYKKTDLTVHFEIQSIK